MAPLASAFIRLRSDSSMLAGDVRRDATRAGATGGTVMGREFGTAFRRVSRTLIGLGIGTFAVEAGRFAIGMADKFELSRSRLENITKNIGGNVQAVDTRVQALDQRMAALGFTNADVEGSLASLESVTKNVQKAITDESLAVNIARGRNIDLESSTQILMRVETGHVAMLSRLGIATKDASGHLLTQKEALAQLTTLYGGAASRFAGEFAGKQQALRAELGNSASEIGVALLPAAVDLAHVLQHDILPAVEDTTKFFDRNRKTIEPLVGWVLKLAIAYKAVSLASKAAGAFRAARVGETAAAGAASTAGLEAFSVARPLPVFVVNNVDTGAPFPAGAPAAESEASKASKIFNSPTAKALIVPAVGYAVFKAMSSNLQRGGIGIPGVFHIGGQQKVDPLGNLSPEFRKQVVALGGLDKALAYYQKLSLAASWSDKSLTGATKDSTASLKEQAKALGHAQQKALDLTGGQDSLRAAIHNMAVVAGGQSSRALKGNSDAALANRDALRGAVSQAEDYLKVLKAHHASAQHVADVEHTLATAIKRSADETYGDKSAVHDLLGQLKFLPGQVDAITAALINMQAAWNPITGSEHAGLSDFVTSKLPKDLGVTVKSLIGGQSKVIDQAAADATKSADTAAQAAWDKAKSRMQADAQMITGFFRQTKAELVSGFATISTQAGSDLLGAAGPGLGVRAQLRQDAAQMHTFAHLWHRLEGMGLDPRLLAQFAGPDYIPAMQELLRGGRKEIRQVDRLETRIARDARGIAATATEDKYGRRLHEDLTQVLPEKLGQVLVDSIPKAIKVTLNTKELDHLEGVKVQHS